MHEYHTIFQTQSQHYIVEQVRQPHNPVVGQGHYLPHHAVIRKDKKTTKVRIVCDTSVNIQDVPSMTA